MDTRRCGVGVSLVASVQAQSTLGGAKPQQNKIGGFAKPAPVIGGAKLLRVEALQMRNCVYSTHPEKI
jgi:hypothetical protein